MGEALMWASQFRQSVGIDAKDVQLSDGSGSAQ